MQKFLCALAYLEGAKARQLARTHKKYLGYDVLLHRKSRMRRVLTLPYCSNEVQTYTQLLANTTRHF